MRLRAHASAGTRRALLRAVAALLLFGVLPPDATAQLTDGDRAWAARAERLDGNRAEAGGIEAAIRHYRLALRADPAALEARWKLLRALHYLIDFSNAGAGRRDEAAAEAVALAERAAAVLESDTAAARDRARLYFWSAIAWGVRAQRVGLFTIVREGVANRMRDHAERSVGLDPGVDRGGALRLLSRLHADLPRVPFVSGWVDRTKVLPLAERAFALDGAHPGNRLILALALLERAPDRHAEARDLLEGIANAEPRSAFIAEDLVIREQARTRLAEMDRKPT